MSARISVILAGLLVTGCMQPPSGPTLAAQPPAGEPAAPPRAKNVILFIGDGMGVSTITAARIYDGQSRGEPGEENLLSFERFPNVALVKTYNTNQQVADSAGTATAMVTGVKTKAGVINVGPQAARGDCAESLQHRLPTIAERLQAGGRAIGMVSTARLTHATPAAVYATSPERNWENDRAIPAAERSAGCTDIASQLVEFPFDVALGGGWAQFYGEALGGARESADANLARDWGMRTGGHVVTGKAGLADLPGDGQPVLGLFSGSHMTYMLDRDETSSEPTLTEMTVAAIDRLAGDDDGYFLMVEGGRIDHAHHAGRAGLALAETQEFARAVGAALERIDLSETLVLVTADHSHVMTIAGYPKRGNPILGLVESTNARGEPAGEPALAADGLPYTTLGYQNGPGAWQTGSRPTPETGPDAVQQATVPLGGETHAGEDVPLYATGPGAENARGVIDQEVIHTIMLRALGAE